MLKALDLDVACVRLSLSPSPHHSHDSCHGQPLTHTLISTPAPSPTPASLSPYLHLHLYLHHIIRHSSNPHLTCNGFIKQMIITRFWDDQNRQDILDRIEHRIDADREKWGPEHRARLSAVSMSRSSTLTIMKHPSSSKNSSCDSSDAGSPIDVDDGAEEEEETTAMA